MIDLQSIIGLPQGIQVGRNKKLEWQQLRYIILIADAKPREKILKKR